MSKADEDFYYIRNTLIPEYVLKMHDDFEHYGSTYQELGLRGQFADIWRKIGPLKRMMWDDESRDYVRETPREICMDLIGHLFLTVMLYDEAVRARSSAPHPLALPPLTPQQDSMEERNMISFLTMKGWHTLPNNWWARGAGPGPAVQFEHLAEAYQYQVDEDRRVAMGDI